MITIGPSGFQQSPRMPPRERPKQLETVKLTQEGVRHLVTGGRCKMREDSRGICHGYTNSGLIKVHVKGYSKPGTFSPRFWESVFNR